MACVLTRVICILHSFRRFGLLKTLLAKFCWRHPLPLSVFWLSAFILVAAATDKARFGPTPLWPTTVFCVNYSLNICTYMCGRSACSIPRANRIFPSGVCDLFWGLPLDIFFLVSHEILYFPLLFT